MSFLIGSGVSAGDATVNDLTVNAIGIGTGTSTASFRLSTDKSAYSGIDGVYSVEWAWTSSTVSIFDVRATLQSGSSPSGDAVGSWLNLSSTRTWSISDSSPNDIPTTSVLLIEIRPSGGGATIDSGTITLSADRQSV